VDQQPIYRPKDPGNGGSTQHGDWVRLALQSLLKLSNP
jgi:hypothetical protein